jgi:hypothetical protein
LGSILDAGHYLFPSSAVGGPAELAAVAISVSLAIEINGEYRYFNDISNYSRKFTEKPN